MDVTLVIAFSATLIFAVGAVPAGMDHGPQEFPLKKVVQGIIDVPVVLPHTAAGIALLGFLSRDGLLGGAAQKAGVLLVNNGAGIALAMAFVSLPFPSMPHVTVLPRCLRELRRPLSLSVPHRRASFSPYHCPRHGDQLSQALL